MVSHNHGESGVCQLVYDQPPHIPAYQGWKGRHGPASEGLSVYIVPLRAVWGTEGRGPDEPSLHASGTKQWVAHDTYNRQSPTVGPLNGTVEIFLESMKGTETVLALDNLLSCMPACSDICATPKICLNPGTKEHLRHMRRPLTFY